MATTNVAQDRDSGLASDGRLDGHTGRRLTTETKSSYKTTEFLAYVAVLIGILIAGAVTKAADYGSRTDPFRSDKVWLYVAILTVGYMISRGLAKAGSRDPYDERR
jgi:hypothetical protein